MLPLLVVTAINFVSVPLFYRYLGPEMYALWFYVSTFSGMFGFADFGLGVAVGRYIGVALGKGDKAAVREYWATGNLIAIPLLALMSLVFIGIGVWLGPLWFDKLKSENTRLLQWAFVFGGCGLFLTYYLQFWLVLSQAHLDFRFIGILRACFSTIQVLSALWLACLTKNPVVIILAGVVLTIIQLGIFVWHSIKNYQLGLNFRSASLERTKEMSHYTLKTFANLLTGSFLGSIDRLLVGKFSPIAFAHYVICSNFGLRIQGLSSAIMGPVFHQTSRAVGKGTHGSVAAIYNETFNFTFAWYALAAIWTVYWHPIFLKLWLGREPGLVESVSPAFTPLIIAYCLSALIYISSAQLGPLNRMGVQLGFTIANCLGLGLCVFFGWHWGGLPGVAWGVLISRLVLVAQDLYLVRLIGGDGWLSLHTWQQLGLQCAVGGMFYLISRTFIKPQSYWELLPATLHGVLVSIWLLRAPLLRMGKKCLFRIRPGFDSQTGH